MTSLTITINGRVYGPRDVRDNLTMNDFLREYLGLTGAKFGCGAGQCPGGGPELPQCRDHLQPPAGRQVTRKKTSVAYNYSHRHLLRHDVSVVFSS